MIKFLSQKQRHIQQLIKDKQFLEAGEAYLALKQPKKALLMFQQGQHFERLAQTYLKIKDWESAVALYLEHGFELKAADILFESKQIEKAAELYQKNHQHKLLGERYYSIEDYENAAQSFLDAKNYELAAKALLKADKLFEAVISLQKAYLQQKKKPNTEQNLAKLKKIGLNTANLLKLTQQYAKAAQIYIDLEYHQEALICYSQLKDYQAAAQLSEMIEDYDNAAVYWKLAGDFGRYQKIDAERLAKRGKRLDAAKKFLAANELSRAADLYLELNDVPKAANLYEKAQTFNKAADCYKLLGKYEKAARLYEQGQTFDAAIECYQLTPFFDKEIFLRTQIGDYLGIAKRYIDMQETSKALEILAQIKPTDAMYFKSLPLKMKAYLLCQHYDLAAKILKELQGKDHFLAKVDLDNLSKLSKEKKYQSFIQSYLNQKILHQSIDKSLISQAEQLKNALELSSVDLLAKQEIPSLEIMINQHSGNIQLNTQSHVRYQKIKEIGRGGMGLIYQALDTVLGRTVALKILSPHFKTNQQSVDTFFREAKSAAILNHPNIITVYDFGIQDNEYYIAMEFIEGRTLKDFIRSCSAVNIPFMMKLFSQMLVALSYAHQQGIVHRDLSSTNIMILRHDMIKIMDFGLAKLIKDLMSEQSIIGGTPSFMSPEQTLGDPIDHRTDIYSLGVLLYEMLTLELPFNKGDLGYHHVHTQAPRPSLKNKHISEKIDELILTCMQKKQEQRFQSIADIQTFLKQEVH